MPLDILLCYPINNRGPMNKTQAMRMPEYCCKWVIYLNKFALNKVCIYNVHDIVHRTLLWDYIANALELLQSCTYCSRKHLIFAFHNTSQQWDGAAVSLNPFSWHQRNHFYENSPLLLVAWHQGTRVAMGMASTQFSLIWHQFWLYNGFMLNRRQIIFWIGIDPGHLRK